MDSKERNEEIVDRILHEAMYRWYLVGAPAAELKEQVDLLEICGRQLLVLRRKLGGESMRALLNYLDRVEEDLVKLAEPDVPAPPPPPMVDEELVWKLARHVDELELSVRAANNLQDARIVYVIDLVTKTEGWWLTRMKSSYPRKTLKETNGILAALGFSLGMKLDDATIAAVRAKITEQEAAK